MYHACSSWVSLTSEDAHKEVILSGLCPQSASLKLTQSLYKTESVERAVESTVAGTHKPGVGNPLEHAAEECDDLVPPADRDKRLAQRAKAKQARRAR